MTEQRVNTDITVHNRDGPRPETVAGQRVRVRRFVRRRDTIIENYNDPAHNGTLVRAIVVGWKGRQERRGCEGGRANDGERSVTEYKVNRIVSLVMNIVVISLW